MSLSARFYKTKKKLSLSKRPSFSKPNLIAFALVFALIGGYVIYRSFAATTVSKTWDSQADFSNGILGSPVLSNVSINSNNTVTLQNQSGWPPPATTNPTPPARANLDFETGDWTQAEIGGGSATCAGNWPYGDMWSADCGGADPRVVMVNAASDPSHVRFGNYALRIKMKTGDNANSVNSNSSDWLQWYNNETTTWCNGAATPDVDKRGCTYAGQLMRSNFKPGQSRADFLPGDTQDTNQSILGRETYWGMSILYDGNTNYGGNDFFAGPNWHGGNSDGCFIVPRYSGIALQGGGGGKLVMIVTGTTYPGGGCNGQPGSLQHYHQFCRAIYFNADDNWTKTWDTFGSCGNGAGDPDLATYWHAVPKDVWLDFAFYWHRSDGPAHPTEGANQTQVCQPSDNGECGQFQLWMKKSTDTAYRAVAPLMYMPTALTYYPFSCGATYCTGNDVNSGQAKIVDQVVPYFGLYRPSTNFQPETIYMDEIKRGPSFNSVMIPGSTVQGAGTSTNYPSTGDITLNYDAGMAVNWTDLGETVNKPAGTNVTYQTRTSNNDVDWSAWAATGSGNSINSPAGRFIQIKATLSSSNSSQTPMIDKLSVNYDLPDTSFLFGTSTAGTISKGIGGGYLEVSRSYTLSTTANLSKLTGYLKGGSTNGSLRGVIYADNGGDKPGAFVAATAPTAINANSAAAWVDFNFTAPLQLPPGKYWLGYWNGSANAQTYYNDLRNSGYYAPASYSSSSNPPSSWPSGGSRYDSSFSLFAAGQIVISTPTDPPVNTSPPTISGITQVGQSLSATAGTWSNSPNSYTYQWQSCDTSGSSCSNISGATNSNYLLTSAELGKTIKAAVTATNTIGSTSATSLQTAAITNLSPPSNTSPPTISGTTQVDSVLTASNGSWDGSPTNYTYQWQSCDSAGNNCGNIATNATNSTYTLTTAEAGKTIKVSVTAYNSAGNTPATSDKTAVIQAAPPPPPPALFGNNTVGSESGAMSTDRKRCSPYVTNTAGTVTDIYVYLAGTNTTGNQAERAVVYAMSGSLPASLLATSAEQQVSGTSTAAWVKFTLSTPLNVVAGQSYCLGLISGATSALMSVYDNPTSGSFLGNADTYSDGPSNPFGTPTPPPDTRNLSIFAAGTATTDTTPPTVSITTPANGSTISGGSVTVSATASDNAAVASVQFYLDYAGNPAANKLGPLLTSPASGSTYTFSPWDTTSLSNGPHSLTAIATDTSTNTTTSSTITVTVDNSTPLTPDTTPPTVPPNLSQASTTDTTADIFWFASSDPTVSGAITSGLKGYNIYRNGNYLTTVIDRLAFSDSNLSPDTTYSYQLEAEDNAGNKSPKSQSLTITTNALPLPTISLNTSSASLSAPGTITLSWSSTDATSCSASGAWSGDKATSGTESLSLSASSTYSLSCSGAGGSASGSVSVTVANQPPPEPTPITSKRPKGDLNADDKINVIDLSILLSGFNSRPSANTGADVNGDGVVNVIDLSILLSNYGK